MFPRMVVDNLIDSSGPDPELSGQLDLHFALLMKLADLPYFVRVQLRSAILYAKRRIKGAIVECVLHVLGIRHIFQIFQRVVAWAQIAMVDHALIWARSQECCCNKLVNHAIVANVVLMEHNVLIPLWISIRRVDATNGCALGLPGSAQSSFIRDAVKVFESNNGPPYFTLGLHDWLASWVSRRAQGAVQWQG